MPTFKIVDGVKIECYSGEGHLPPHVHVKYSGDEALIVIETLEIYEGSLPKNKLKIARKGIEENRES